MRLIFVLLLSVFCKIALAQDCGIKRTIDTLNMSIEYKTKMITHGAGSISKNPPYITFSKSITAADTIYKMEIAVTTVDKLVMVTTGVMLYFENGKEIYKPEAGIYSFLEEFTMQDFSRKLVKSSFILDKNDIELLKSHLLEAVKLSIHEAEIGSKRQKQVKEYANCISVAE